MGDYLAEIKANLEERIPEYGSKDFEKMKDQIRKELSKKENDLLLITRSLKVLILGDWHTKEKAQLLWNVRNLLLKNGVYAETVDSYYDPKRRGGLSQLQVLQTCCTLHQLIVFIDGEGKGTVTEQTYLAREYPFHGKIIFFIDESKFDELKDKPNSYIRSFPTIIPYKKSDLLDTIVIFSRLRIYRLAGIIQQQETSGKGLKSPQYEPWKERLARRR